MTMAGWAMEPTDIKIENTKKTTAWERKSFVMKQIAKPQRNVDPGYAGGERDVMEQ
jgi:hypothetical protein